MMTNEELFIDRSQYIEQLSNIIKSEQAEEFFPLAIDGMWGSGKTALCEIIERNLAGENDFKILRLDAFKYDYIKDPFVAIFSSLKDIKEGGFDNKINEFMLASLKMGASYVNKLLYAKSLGLIDLTKFKKEKPIDKKQIESIESMAYLLDGLKKKHVIIVDELDRCRPEFTIMFLEAVKHFFDKKNLMFIFMINRSQLEKVIHHKYGYSSDENYLNKFFKLNMSLPNLKNTSDIVPAEYILTKLDSNNLVDSKMVEKIKNTDRSISTNITRAIKLIITEVIEKRNYSLRDMDEVIKYVRLYCVLEKRTNIDNDYELFVLITSIIILKSAPDLSITVITVDNIVEGADCQKLNDLFNITANKYALNGINQQNKIDELLYTKKIIYSILKQSFSTEKKPIDIIRRNSSNSFINIVVAILRTVF